MIHSPVSLSVTPHPFLNFTDRMTFGQRMENIISTVIEDFGFYIYHFPLQASIYDKYFKADKPLFKHMLKHSVSLVLLNTHYSLNFPQAYLPNMVSWGNSSITILKRLNRKICRLKLEDFM
jgi:hypothetical protein